VHIEGPRSAVRSLSATTKDRARVADKSPRRSRGAAANGHPALASPVVSVLVYPCPGPFTGVRGRLSGLVTDAGGRW